MMEPDQLLGVLAAEGAKLAAMPADALDASVPTVPGWTLEDVLRHTGKVHRWVGAVLDAGPAADTSSVKVPSLPRGPEVLPAYRAALDELVATFEGLDPSAPASTFIGPGTVAWWIRRQAHEATVHRFDAAFAVEAAGGPAPESADAASASDGIGELSEVQWIHRLKFDELTNHAGKTIHLHGTDVDDAEWLLTLGREALVSERSHTKADVALRGSAIDLLLVLCRRKPLTVLQVFGDADLADSFVAASRY